MHDSAMNNGKAFFETYVYKISPESNLKVVEIGSQDVNGTLRDLCPSNFEYIGLDFQHAKGVDIVMEDPYKIPLESSSIDIVLSSSCFEHSEFFWLIFLEILRVLKPNGLFYLNAPSTGGYHRYPVDCWRFYPDSGKALVAWAKHNGINATLLESYTQIGGNWQDFVAVFLKDESESIRYPNRIISTKKDFENGWFLGGDEVINASKSSQNIKKLNAIKKIINET
jgi:SAM-dependent methyltransferase